MNIFKTKNILLAQSIVYKSKTYADQYNENMRNMGVDVPFHKEDWVYYKHLNGEYTAIDPMIEIVSLDTLETIEFKKDVLTNHPSTKEAYTVGSLFYNRLVELYPNQELLIRGIITPVDKQVAMDAEEGTVLMWNDHLVEPNETDLIDKIGQWLNHYLTFHNNDTYGLVEKYYSTALAGMIASLLPSKIMNIRLGNIKTSRVHSFHIKRTLASHQSLDEFYGYMTLEQRLWLYRNLNYLKNRAGQKEIFDFLIENIMSSRGLSVVEFDLHQNHTKILEDLVPDPTVAVKYRNFVNKGFKDEVDSVNNLVNKMAYLTKGNRELFESSIDKTEHLTRIAGNTRMKTKVLESRAVDKRNSQEVRFDEMLISHWAYLAHQGSYSAILPVVNPVTGLEQTFNAKEAFWIYWYSYYASEGMELTIVPEVVMTNIQKSVKPEMTKHYSWFGRQDDRIDLMHSRIEPHGFYTSSKDFNEHIRTVHKTWMSNSGLYKAERHVRDYGKIKEIQRDFYDEYLIKDTESGRNYVEWLADRNIDATGFKRFDHVEMMRELLSKFTGIDLSNDEDIRNIQTAMVKIMRRMSSYNIQFLETLDQDTSVLLDWSRRRLGDLNGKTASNTYIPLQGVVEQTASLSRSDHDLNTTISIIPGMTIHRSKVDLTMTHRVSQVGNTRSSTYLRQGLGLVVHEH